MFVWTSCVIDVPNQRFGVSYLMNTMFEPKLINLSWLIKFLKNLKLN